MQLVLMARLLNAVRNPSRHLRCSWQVVSPRPAQSSLAVASLEVPSQYVAHASITSRTTQRKFCSRATPATSKADSTPVILLSGFLGAGKTTLLDHLLRGDHGMRLGVIVNDLASVNVDARVLEDAVIKSGAKSIELANGCVCCSASDDLRGSILDLCAASSGNARLDAIIVELSGVAEPAGARTVFDGFAYTPPAHIAQTVTVIDAAAFATDFNAKSPPGTPKSEERLASLLAEQIEDADILVFNKADMATAAELRQAEALASALNRKAQQLVVEHGRVQPQLLLRPKMAGSIGSSGGVSGVAPEQQSDNIQPDHSGHAHGHDHGHHSGHAHGHGHGHAHSHEHGHCEDEHCTDPSHDHRSSAERRFGIKSFVYTSPRPFHRTRFVVELQQWQNSLASMGKTLNLLEDSMEVDSPTAAPAEQNSSASPFSSVLRSKGLFWMNVQPAYAFYWGHAGRCVRMNNVGVWGEESVSTAGRPTPSWPPRTELVFIGAGMDEAAMRAALDQCLVTEEEYELVSAAVEMLNPRPREESLAPA